MFTNKTLGTRASLALCLGLGLVLMLASGCTGSNDIHYKETNAPKADRDFTEFAFQEQDPAVKVPAGLPATLQSDLSNYWERQIQHLQDLEKQGEALGALKTIKFRKMTVQYRIVAYDPGQPMLRRFLGGLGIGDAKMVVDAKYLDNHGQELSTAQYSAVLGDEPQMLESDTETLASMFVTSDAQYIKEKHYLLHPQEKKN